MARVESKKTDREHTPELVDNLVKAAMQCQGSNSLFKTNPQSTDVIFV